LVRGGGVGVDWPRIGFVGLDASTVQGKLSAGGVGPFLLWWCRGAAVLAKTWAVLHTEGLRPPFPMFHLKIFWSFENLFVAGSGE